MPQPPANVPQLSAFDAIRHVDEQGDEYWLARELAQTLGYSSPDSWKNFERVIDEAKAAAQSQGYDIERLFADISKKSTGGRPGKDYRLARFGCYMIALSADGAKEEVAAAKVYFAVKTREQELAEQELAHLASQLEGDPLAEVINRILLRQELTEANKELLARARDAGIITPRQYALFMNQGYRGLYNGETRDDIHRRKGLKPNQDISDYMGVVETFANLLRAQIAAREMQAQSPGTPHAAGEIHHEAGEEVRELLLHAGYVPEQLPTPTKSYRQIVQEEAARIQREDEDARGLWDQLPRESS